MRTLSMDTTTSTSSATSSSPMMRFAPLGYFPFQSRESAMTWLGVNGYTRDSLCSWERSQWWIYVNRAAITGEIRYIDRARLRKVDGEWRLYCEHLS